jgi:hypothetical protein
MIRLESRLRQIQRGHAPRGDSPFVLRSDGCWIRSGGCWSRGPAQILGARPCRAAYLIAMISFLDWAVVGAWHDGQLRRAVSVT